MACGDISKPAVPAPPCIVRTCIAKDLNRPCQQTDFDTTTVTLADVGSKLETYQKLYVPVPSLWWAYCVLGLLIALGGVDGLWVPVLIPGRIFKEGVWGADFVTLAGKIEELAQSTESDGQEAVATNPHARRAPFRALRMGVQIYDQNSNRFLVADDWRKHIIYVSKFGIIDSYIRNMTLVPCVYIMFCSDRWTVTALHHLLPPALPAAQLINFICADLFWHRTMWLLLLPTVAFFLIWVAVSLYTSFVVLGIFDPEDEDTQKAVHRASLWSSSTTRFETWQDSTFTLLLGLTFLSQGRLLLVQWAWRLPYFAIADYGTVAGWVIGLPFFADFALLLGMVILSLTILGITCAQVSVVNQHCRGSIYLDRHREESEDGEVRPRDPRAHSPHKLNRENWKIYGLKHRDGKLWLGAFIALNNPVALIAMLSYHGLLHMLCAVAYDSWIYCNCKLRLQRFTNITDLISYASELVLYNARERTNEAGQA